MNNPSPLIPQGSLQSQMKGRSNVQLAVITIVAIHVVFFGGLLLQGCKRNTQTGSGATETNVTETLTYTPMDTNAGMYYTSPSTLPTNTPTTPVSTAATPQTPDYSLGSSTPSGSESLSPSSLGAGAITQEPATQMKDYTVVKGDSFYKIAKANHITVAALTRANPNIDPAKLRPGAKINLPVSEARPASSTSTAANGIGASTAGGGVDGATYTVKPGDNLTKIARNNGTTVSALRAANGLKVSRLLVGQKIKLPASARRSSTDTGATSAPQPESTIIP